MTDETKRPHYTQAEAEVIAAVCVSTRFGFNRGEPRAIHDAEVIEGIEHRSRVFGRPVPMENDIRKAIRSLLERGELGRDERGWLVLSRPSHPAAKPASAGRYE